MFLTDSAATTAGPVLITDKFSEKHSIRTDCSTNGEEVKRSDDPPAASLPALLHDSLSSSASALENTLSTDSGSDFARVSRTDVTFLPSNVSAVSVARVTTIDSEDTQCVDLIQQHHTCCV